MTYWSLDVIEQVDPHLAAFMRQEASRQHDHIELIASENYTSTAIMAAQGSLLTNKYAEGYPGKRYYGGCQHVDDIERLAIERACSLFSAAYANVQPHSGSQANAAVFLALLKPGDLILSLSLASGGHLTHGSSVNFSGKLYRAEHYEVGTEDGLLDYEAIAEQARACRPQLIIAGFSAYSRIIDWARLREIADEVGAFFLADMAHNAGLIAAGLYPSPIAHADVVTSTTHKTLRGPRSGMILSRDEGLAKKLNSAVFPGTQGGPLMHVIAAKALCFLEASSPAFTHYQKNVLANAKAMVQVVQEQGGVVVSHGTDTHQFLLDLRPWSVSGADLQHWLELANITLNKNAIPADPLPPRQTSGVRIGSAAITTRGMGEEEVRLIGRAVMRVCQSRGDASVMAAVRKEMTALTKRFALVGLV